MTPKTPVSSVEISFFVHATEDPDRVVEAVLKTLLQAHLNEIVFQRDCLEGYHGNPIVFFKTTIRKKPIIKAFIESLASKLDADEKERLISETERHMDRRGDFYLRLDKQSACLGDVRIGTADPIRIRMRLDVRPKSVERMSEVCRELITSTREKRASKDDG